MGAEKDGKVSIWRPGTWIAQEDLSELERLSSPPRQKEWDWAWRSLDA